MPGHASEPRPPEDDLPQHDSSHRPVVQEGSGVGGAEGHTSETKQSGVRVRRERDPLGRPQNARPRDGLGRPLPRDAEGGVPRIPDDVMLPPLPALAEAQRLLDEGMPFHAHEILEGTWKSCTASERDLWQGLAQLAVGFTHLLRGNRKGALTLLERARTKIEGYRSAPPYGIDIDGLIAWCDDVRDRLAVEDQQGPVGIRPTTPILRA